MRVDGDAGVDKIGLILDNARLSFVQGAGSQKLRAFKCAQMVDGCIEIRGAVADV